MSTVVWSGRRGATTVRKLGGQSMASAEREPIWGSGGPKNWGDASPPVVAPLVSKVYNTSEPLSMYNFLGRGETLMPGKLHLFQSFVLYISSLLRHWGKGSVDPRSCVTVSALMLRMTIHPNSQNHSRFMQQCNNLHQ